MESLHELYILLMLLAFALGFLRNNEDMAGINQRCANGVPKLLPSSGRKFIVASFVWLSCAKQFLADLVSVFVKEPLQDD